MYGVAGSDSRKAFLELIEFPLGAGAGYGGEGRSSLSCVVPRLFSVYL